MKIKLDTLEKIKLFIRQVTKFESDVDIIKGSVVYDAKSIVAVMGLDTSSCVEVEILSKDDNEIEKFNKEMEEFA